jgi:tRNA (adenine57-N1/adenine58-N1)-methyltransferase
VKQVVLIDSKGKKRVIPLTGEITRINGLGVLDTSKIDESTLGNTIEIGDTKFLVLEPTLLDRVDSITRKAQIVLPKDAASIIVNCDIKSGSTVIEGGTGSGALTIVLGNFIRPNGEVISYESRKDFLKIARRNIKNAGMLDFCSLKEADITKNLAERNVDAVVLDIPNPWKAIGLAHEALKPGGRIACYVPTMNQVERTVRELEMHSYIELRTIEILEREMVVGDMGTRPSFKMLGHTGYLTFARKVIEVFP